MKTFTSIITSLCIAFSCSSNNPNIKYTQISEEEHKRVLNAFQKAYDDLEQLCIEPFTQEIRKEGESPKEFCKRFCEKYGIGGYQNLCNMGRYDPKHHWYHISCEKNNECRLLIDGEIGSENNFHGKYD